MSWSITVHRDVVRGQYHQAYSATVLWERCHVMARRLGVTYLHFYDFGDDFDAAQRLVARIRAEADFTPEGKADLWRKILDIRPINLYKKDWRRLAMYGPLRRWASKR